MKSLSFLSILILLSCSSENSIILNEEFNDNRLGWVEEWTEYHHTEISDGKLIIKSLDTAADLSSNGPRDRSFMWSLPNHWGFSTSIEVIDGGEEAGFGVLLASATLDYQFRLSRDGKLKIFETDYNAQQENVIEDKELENFKIDYNEPVKLSIIVKDDSFEFFVNDIKQSEGTFSAKSWGHLRIFAKSGGTGIKADYYRIIAL